MNDWMNRPYDDPWLTPDENAANRQAYAPDVTAVCSIAADPALDPGTLCTINAATQPPRTGAAVPEPPGRSETPEPRTNPAVMTASAADPVWQVAPDFRPPGWMPAAERKAAWDKIIAELRASD